VGINYKGSQGQTERAVVPEEEEQEEEEEVTFSGHRNMFQCFKLFCGDGGGTATFTGTSVHPTEVRSVDTERWRNDN
jgi:hypothetical protein